MKRSKSKDSQIMTILKQAQQIRRQGCLHEGSLQGIVG